MLNMLIYLFLFAIVLDQLSAVNKNLNQVPASSKMKTNPTFGINQSHG